RARCWLFFHLGVLFDLDWQAGAFAKATACQRTLPALQFRMSSIAENLERGREQIAAASAKSGRSANDVGLVLIPKTHPPERVREAIEAGQTLFGESRVQEARAKIPELPSNVRWHFVGHLQKNKIRHALPLFQLIHSVDSLALAQEMDRMAQEEGFHPRVL